jgi:transposase-like protein
MTRAERRSQWRAIIENQATSGVSIAAYCRDTQIKPSYFYTWRRRLREQQPCAGGFLELIPDRLTESTASGIRIRLGGKLAIEVERGFDPYTLRAVVETLSGLSRCSA